MKNLAEMLAQVLLPEALADKECQAVYWAEGIGGASYFLMADPLNTFVGKVKNYLF